MKKLLVGLFLLFCIGLADSASVTAPNVGTTALEPGRKFSVTADAGNVLVQRFNGTTLVSTVSVSAGNTQTFGEYFIRQQFKVIPLTGGASYSDSQSTDPISTISAITSGTISGVTLSASTITDTGLTSTRVPFASTGGLLADSSAFTFSAGTLTATTFSGAIASHLKVTGLVPVPGACGTGPTLVGSDNGMSITVGTGDVDTACVVTFGTAWANAPVCIAQSDTDILALGIVTTLTTLTVSKAAAFTAGSKLHVICMGY